MSDDLYQRARDLMPWGTQTNAKRPVAGLEDVMPLFFDRADGLPTPHARGPLVHRLPLVARADPARLPTP